ncbi:hypothetical protein THIOKS11160002 [Thiocapsa sp. KS1]|nr:hypothetical protein THIOKS11160002 [Thiocapsa sp. KS1]
MRRLLEDGANSSFVNLLRDERLPIHGSGRTRRPRSR